tara:strand:+ start:194 stop:820 length:627 start_codon:yes stop_codon:yes gene_type:complete
MKHITSREEMIATLLQIAYDSNLVGAIQEDASEWSTDLNWINDLTKTQKATLETDFVSKCISLANSLMNEKELDISENDPLALLDYKAYDLAEIQDSTNVELNNLKAENEILTSNLDELKETTDLAIDNSALQVESLMNELHDANETIYQYASDPKREKLANEIINLKEKNNDLTNALKSSLSQVAYLCETVKTFDADFFKIKDFNNS